jgi:hypothetical protein
LTGQRQARRHTGVARRLTSSDWRRRQCAPPRVGGPQQLAQRASAGKH